jgi:hypothetical protein
MIVLQIFQNTTACTEASVAVVGKTRQWTLSRRPSWPRCWRSGSASGSRRSTVSRVGARAVRPGTWPPKRLTTWRWPSCSRPSAATATSCWTTCTGARRRYRPRAAEVPCWCTARGRGSARRPRKISVTTPTTTRRTLLVRVPLLHPVCEFNGRLVDEGGFALDAPGARSFCDFYTDKNLEVRLCSKYIEIV